MAGYPDLRYKFIRGLIKYEHTQRRHHYDKSAAEWTSKAIVSLSLVDHPIRSTKQARQLEGIGTVLGSELNKILRDSTFSEEPPLSGKLPSTGSALLVALLIGTEEERKKGSSDLPLVGEEKLKEYCEPLSEEKFNPKSYALDGSSGIVANKIEQVFCPAWWRINVLISRGLVKRRTRGKRPVYELLAAGEELAQNIRATCTALNGRQVGSIRPRVPEQSVSVHSASQSRATNPQPDALYSNDDGSDGVILLVDRHELGGDRVRLGEVPLNIAICNIFLIQDLAENHALSRRLSEWDVQHRTSPLPCGDYMWKWRHNGKETTLPVLMERKRADDLAGSIKDGRYVNQKEKMLEWKKDFGIMSGDVSLQYVVESDPAAYRVACADGCSGVGKCGNPTVEQVESVISELEESVDFQLLKTQNIEGTVELLASITAELTQRVIKGEFEVLKSLPIAHTKSKSKAFKTKHRVTTNYGLNSRTSPVYSHNRSPNTFSSCEILNDGMRSSAGSLPFGENTFGGLGQGFQEISSRKRSRYRAIQLDDLTEIGTTQASRSKKKRNSSRTSRTSTSTSFYNSDVDEYLVLDIPVLNLNTSKSVLDKGEKRYESDKYRWNVGGKCSSQTLVPSPHSSCDWSDSDDDLPPSGVWDDRPFKDSLSERSSETRTSQSNLEHQTELSSRISKSMEESDDAKIAALRDALPDSSLDEIITALSSAGGSVQKVMERVNNSETKASDLVTRHSPAPYSPLSKYTALTKDSTTTSSPLHSVEDSDDAKIAAVQIALPGSSFEKVISALTSAGGDVEQAIVEAAKNTELDISRKVGDHSTTQLSCVVEENEVRSVPIVSSPSFNARSSDGAAKIAAVQDVLPDSSLEIIVAALSASKGDVEQAIMDVVNNSNNEHSGFTGGNLGGRSSPKSKESLVFKRKTEPCSLEQFDDAKLSLVRDVLPQASLDNIVTALKMTGGNVEQAIFESAKISETEAQSLDECDHASCSLPVSKKLLVSKNAPLSTVARGLSDIMKYSDDSTASIRGVLPDKSFYNVDAVVYKSTGSNLEQVILESEETEGFDKNYSSPTSLPLLNNTVFSKGKRSSVISDSSNGDVTQFEDFKITAVRDVLPDASVESIIEALDITEGNVEQAVMELLNTSKRSVKQNCSGANFRTSRSHDFIDLTY